MRTNKIRIKKCQNQNLQFNQLKINQLCVVLRFTLYNNRKVIIIIQIIIQTIIQITIQIIIKDKVLIVGEVLLVVEDHPYIYFPKMIYNLK